jgi:cytochrome c551/c552
VRTPAALAALFVAAAISMAAAAAAPSDWVGNDACGACHEDAVLAWRAGPHAAASESLGAHRDRASCLGCHATGEAPAGRALFAGVGCESCHGPGVAYAPDDVMRDPPLRAALGLVDLSTPAARAPVCLRCHQVELGPRRFDVEAAWRSLPHGRSP